MLDTGCGHHIAFQGFVRPIPPNNVSFHAAEVNGPRSWCRTKVYRLSTDCTVRRAQRGRWWSRSDLHRAPSREWASQACQVDTFARPIEALASLLIGLHDSGAPVWNRTKPRPAGRDLQSPRRNHRLSGCIVWSPYLVLTQDLPLTKRLPFHWTTGAGGT